MSEIKVNKISPKQTCTQVTLGDSGDDIIVASGVNFKTPSVKDASGNIIISRCGSNITIGSSGAAVALAAGTTQSGFGPTGAVSWNTTKITADPNPAVSGVGYFADTTSSAFTVTLPAAPSAGDIVALSDYTGTWATNNLTVGRNSSNINGAAADLILNADNTTATLIYVDGTEGWRVIDTGSLSEINLPEYIAATGGTITTCGDYKIHTFTGPGTFTVTNDGNPVGSNSVSYLVVAGGGSGGAGLAPSPGDAEGGGGGAGGFREGKASTDCYAASPLNAPEGLPVSVQGYSITVGAGGAEQPDYSQGGNPGSNSIFSSITSAGGGGGGSRNTPPGSGPAVADAGGSGGGAGQADSPTSYPGAGNTPPVSPPQGNSGGNAAFPSSPGSAGAGGGGGATAAGGNAIPGPSVGGPGGAGATTSISASPTAYAGGGGGSGIGSPSPGGIGGGGQATVPGVAVRTAGTTNTGGGGGGGGGNPGSSGAAGGSGIVIIRYKYQ
jgi:hypothetical protein